MSGYQNGLILQIKVYSTKLNPHISCFVNSVDPVKPAEQDLQFSSLLVNGILRVNIG